MSPNAVLALHLKPAKGELLPVESLQAEAGMGFVGDRHYGKPSRQVLFVSVSELKSLGYLPGDLREQVTVNLPGLQGLGPGTRLEFASGAAFEIEQDCAPCAHMAKTLDEDPEDFKAKTAGRRGMLAIVVGSGPIRVGDLITVANV